MEPSDKVFAFIRTLGNILDTYQAKNHDYGDSFGKTFSEFGELAGLVRIKDKVNRLTSLQGKEPAYESRIDSYLDIACYCIMQVIEMEGEEDD